MAGEPGRLPTLAARLRAAGRPGSLGGLLMRGGVSAISVNVLGVGLAFLSQLVLARVLGAHEYGLYAYVFAWVMMLGLLSVLGFQIVLLRLVATYAARQAWGALNGLIRYAERRVLLAGLTVMLVGWLVVGLLAGLDERAWLAPELRRVFLIGLLIVPLYALLYVRSAIARGLGRVFLALAPDATVREGLVLVLVGGVALTGLFQPHAWFAITALLVAILTGLVLITLVKRQARPEAARAVAPAIDEVAEWRRAVRYTFVFSASMIMLPRLDVIFVGNFVDTATAGAYFLAVRITDLVVFPLIAINAFFGPIVARYHSQGQRLSLYRAVLLMIATSASIGLALTTGIFFLYPDIIGFIGRDFRLDASIIVVLLLGQLINASTGPTTQLLNMTGHERDATTIVLASLLLTVVGLSVLVPLFGADGAALVRAGVTALANLTYFTVAWSRLGFWSRPRAD